eukprot:jgi/Mesen1/3271/ME000019S02687
MEDATGRKLLTACGISQVSIAYSSGGTDIHVVTIKNTCASRLNMCLLSGCQSWYDEGTSSDAYFEQTQTYPGLCRVKVPIAANSQLSFSYKNYYGWTFCRQHLRWDNGNEVVNNGPTPC